MQILSSTLHLMVGQTALGFPLPIVLPAFPGIQASHAAFLNMGGSDAYVAIGSSPGVTANTTSGILVPAGSFQLPAGTLRPDGAIQNGPFVYVPIVAGQQFFSAIAAPIQIITATTYATASANSTSLVVADASGIAVGQAVAASVGIAPNTTVTNVSGTTITISLATTAPLSNTEVQFSAVASPAPPAALSVALAKV